MSFRSIAALFLAGGALTLIFALSLLGDAPGVAPEARHLRALKRRLDPPAAYADWTQDSIAALPHGRPLAEYAPLERRGVRLEGWVQRTMAAGDGDMHLELCATARTSGGRDTAYTTGEITPGWRRPGAWQFEALNAVFRPNDGAVTPWDGGPAKVRVSGWLLYDFQYDRPPTSWSLQNGAPRVSGWEIHPVTRIERWSARERRWIEVAS